MIIPSYILKCDHCKTTYMQSVQGVYFHPGPVKRKEIREIARQHAWKQWHNTDLCPDCFIR